MTLKSEVLPAPLGPMTAKSSPGSTSNETSESALTPSKRTEMFDTESSGARAGSGPFAPLNTLLSLIGPLPFGTALASGTHAAPLSLVQAKIKLAHAFILQQLGGGLRERHLPGFQHVAVMSKRERHLS